MRRLIGFIVLILISSISRMAHSQEGTHSISVERCLVRLVDALEFNMTAAKEVCATVENSEQIECYISTFKSGWTNYKYGVHYCRAKYHPDYRQRAESKCYVILVDGLEYNSDWTKSQCSNYPDEYHSRCFVQKTKAGWTNSEYANNYCRAYAKEKNAEDAGVSKEEVESNARLPADTSLIIKNELYIPSEVGCAAIKNGVTPVQCFSCLDRKLKNDFFFPESSIPSGILTVASVSMASDQKSIDISLNSNQTGIGKLYCRSPQKIVLRKQKDLVDILKRNDVEVVLPPAVVFEAPK